MFTLELGAVFLDDRTHLHDPDAIKGLSLKGAQAPGEFCQAPGDPRIMFVELRHRNLIL
jgi:hypothetical protein